MCRRQQSECAPPSQARVAHPAGTSWCKALFVYFFIFVLIAFWEADEDEEKDARLGDCE